QSNGLSSFSAEIFNRWGVKVYTWTDPLKGWDGRNTGGTEMSAGTYYYLINATGVDGVKYAEKGFITLIR
ncbi:MAG: gliding motility-associated C-terminal domain-containing protein, partial [Bacteroidia bacterium]